MQLDGQMHRFFFFDSRLTRPADCDLSRLEPPSEAAPIVT